MNVSVANVPAYRHRTGVALEVPGHGPVSDHPAQDLAQTRDYLAYLRQVFQIGAPAATAPTP